MKIQHLLETIDRDITRKGDNAKPEKLSSFVKADSIQDMYSKIERFFNDSNFSYGKFKDLFSTGPTSPFGIGLDNAKKIQAFGEKSYVKDGKSKGELYYDEYVETFFIYIYYQVFIKALSSQIDLRVKNSKGIENAKKILRRNESAQEDIIEGLKNIYKSCMKMFLVDQRASDVVSTKESRRDFIEAFANKNISMFTEYPISSRFTVEFDAEKADSDIAKAVDAVFDSLKIAAQSDELKNQQALSVGLFSQFIKEDGTFDFDVEKFSGENSKKYDLFPVPSFLSKSSPIADDILNELAEGIDDSMLESFGMSWLIGSKWKPFVKIILAIKSLAEIDESIGKAAKAVDIKTRKYTQFLDSNEKDGGLHFINNMAFYETLKTSDNPNIQEIKNIVYDLNDMMERMSKKVNYFTQMSIENFKGSVMLTDKESNAFAQSYDDLSSNDKKTIVNILNLTGFMDIFGTSDVGKTVEKLNSWFFEPTTEPESELKSSSGVDLSMPIKYAARNVASYEVKSSTNTVSELGAKDALLKTLEFGNDITIGLAYNLAKPVYDVIKNGKSVWTAMGELKSAVMDGVVQKWFPEKEVINKLEGDQKKIVITVGDNTVEIKNTADWINYIQKQGKSFACILCHGKIVFSPSGESIHNDAATIQEMYKKYDNVLSWYIINVSKDPKLKESYRLMNFGELVTPFLLETLKYGLRAFINNSHKMIRNEELTNRIEDANGKQDIEEGEWKELVSSLKDELESVLSKKLKGSSISQNLDKPVAGNEKQSKKGAPSKK